jgi:catalase
VGHGGANRRTRRPDHRSVQGLAGHRQEATLGTLSVTRAEPQAAGACRDLNFDPLILPTGIAASDDPVLHARSAAYSVSFNRREREISQGKSAYPTSQNGSAR